MPRLLIRAPSLLTPRNTADALSQRPWIAPPTFGSRTAMTPSPRPGTSLSLLACAWPPAIPGPPNRPPTWRVAIATSAPSTRRNTAAPGTVSVSPLSLLSRTRADEEILHDIWSPGLLSASVPPLPAFRKQPGFVSAHLCVASSRLGACHSLSCPHGDKAPSLQPPSSDSDWPPSWDFEDEEASDLSVVGPTDSCLAGLVLPNTILLTLEFPHYSIIVRLVEWCCIILKTKKM